MAKIDGIWVVTTNDDPYAPSIFDYRTCTVCGSVVHRYGWGLHEGWHTNG